MRSGFPALYDCAMRTAERGRLAELRRVLRPGGVARLLEHVRLERPIIGWVQDVATPVWRRIAGGCRLNERSVDTVRRAGFQIDEVRSALGGYVVMIEATRADAGRS